MYARTRKTKNQFGGNAAPKKTKRARAECAEDDEMCARETTDIQEEILYKLLKDEAVLDSDISTYFKCGAAKIHTLVANLHGQYPSLKGTIKKMGGQANFDFYFEKDGATKRIELKTGKSTSTLEKLTKKPWSAYGQFFQGFLKESKDYGESKRADIINFAKPLIRRWYDEIIVGDLMKRYNISDPIDFASYYYLMFQSSSTAAKQYNNPKLALGARKLFKLFHESGICGKGKKVTNPSEKEYISRLWKKFANDFVKANKLSDAQMLSIINSSLSQKDLWICTTKNNAFIIEGPRCLSVKFKNITEGNDVITAIYEAELKKPSEAESYSVNIEFRLTWRNCSQGIHNLAFQIS
jgi:hypothetical protein